VSHRGEDRLGAADGDAPELVDLHQRFTPL
jgi:hypothetical protein